MKWKTWLNTWQRQHKSSSNDMLNLFRVLEYSLQFSTNNTVYNVQLILVAAFEFSGATQVLRMISYVTRGVKIKLA